MWRRREESSSKQWEGSTQLECILLLPWGLLYIWGDQLVSQEERAKRSKGISPKRRQKGSKSGRGSDPDLIDQITCARHAAWPGRRPASGPAGGLARGLAQPSRGPAGVASWRPNRQPAGLARPAWWRPAARPSGLGPLAPAPLPFFSFFFFFLFLFPFSLFISSK